MADTPADGNQSIPALVSVHISRVDGVQLTLVPRPKEDPGRGYGRLAKLFEGGRTPDYIG
jgi:hypothetical protein